MKTIDISIENRIVESLGTASKIILSFNEIKVMLEFEKISILNVNIKINQ